MSEKLTIHSIETDNRITSTFTDEFLQDEIIGKTYFDQELSKLLNQNENSYETIFTTINDKEQSILSTIDDNTAKIDAIGNLNDFFNAMNNAKI